MANEPHKMSIVRGGKLDAASYVRRGMAFVGLRTFRLRSRFVESHETHVTQGIATLRISFDGPNLSAVRKPGFLFP
jgi:hypothetical protein